MTATTFGRRSPPDWSALVRLGTLAGGLLGYGAGVLLQSDSGDLTGITSASGAVAGFAAIFPTVERSPGVGARAGNLQLHLAPQGIASLVKTDLFSRSGFATPVASVRYRFQEVDADNAEDIRTVPAGRVRLHRNSGIGDRTTRR